MVVNDILTTYLNSLAQLKGVGKGINSILIQFLNESIKVEDKLMLYLNRTKKEEIALACGVTRPRVEQVITRLVKFEYINRVGTSTFELNTNLFGCFNWKKATNLKQISYTIDISSDNSISVKASIKPIFD